MMSTNQASLIAEGGVDLVSAMVVLAFFGFALAFGGLMIGKLIRPHWPHPVKGSPYECGELAVGPSWVQFDLRFYVVALMFLIFDVETALLFTWAVVFGGEAHPNASMELKHQIKWAASWDMLFFVGVVVVGFLYLWRFGYLDWVRSSSAQQDGLEETES